MQAGTRLCLDVGGVLELAKLILQRLHPGLLPGLLRLGLGDVASLGEVLPKGQRRTHHQGAHDQAQDGRPGGQPRT